MADTKKEEIKTVNITVPEELKTVYESNECANFVKLLSIKNRAENLYNIYMNNWCKIYLEKEDKDADNEEETKVLEVAVILGKILNYSIDEITGHANYLVEEATKEENKEEESSSAPKYNKEEEL